MKLTKTATALALAMSIPLFIQSGAQAQNNVMAAPNAVEAAQDRLEKAKVRLEIARKQVEAAKARLRAAEAEHKAAVAHHDAKQLESKAGELADESGLPAITDTMIDNGRRNSKIATVLKMDRKAQAKKPGQSVEVSGDIRLNKAPVDFNGQPNQQQPVSAPVPTPNDAQRLNHQSFNQNGANLRPTLTASAPSGMVPQQGALEPPQIVP